MSNAMEKWRNDDEALAAERDLMNKALSRITKGAFKTERQPAGRLIFGLDLTGSREDGLRQARLATSAMFDAIKVIGTLLVKLVYYRGTNECRASQWHADASVLAESMGHLSCETGYTQIARLLRMALAEEEKLTGVVFVGDHCEDAPRELRRLAAVMGEKKIPLFIFHECADHDRRSLEAKPLFKDLAAASGGVYVEFKPDSGAVLREMLAGVPAFSAGGAEGVKRAALPGTREGQQLRKRLMLGAGDDLQ